MLVTSRQFRWAQSSDHRLATTDATAEALGSGFLLATFVSLGVMAFNPAKNFQARATTDDQGMYRFLYLEPATYVVTFTHSGFRTLERSGLQLRSNDTLSVDVELGLGDVIEKVEVTTATPLLESVTSTTAV